MDRAPLHVFMLGKVNYGEGLLLQERLVASRQRGTVPDTLLLLEHPPVLTIGRHGDRRNVLVPDSLLEEEGIKVYEVNRGGDVTYHGPGQLVGYPIIDLKGYGRDVHAYYANLEQVFIDVLSEYQLAARRDESYPGVWVGNKKITAIGVAVKKWVTMHGFAFNVRPDLRHFKLINPCGIVDRGVTSLEQCVPAGIDPVQVEEQVIQSFARIFDLNPVNFKRGSVNLARVRLSSLVNFESAR